MEVSDVVETMDLLKLIITNILTALYQPFWFSLLLTIFIMFFYLLIFYFVAGFTL